MQISVNEIQVVSKYDFFLRWNNCCTICVNNNTTNIYRWDDNHNSMSKVRSQRLMPYAVV